jgi:hypothetical protein
MKKRVEDVFDTMLLRGYTNEIPQKDINTTIWEVCGYGDERTFKKYTKMLIQMGKIEKVNQYVFKVKNNGLETNKTKIDDFKTNDENSNDNNK